MNATASLDRYVVDVLMRDLIGHDRRPAAFLVYVFLATRDAEDQLPPSHAALAERIGLSRRAVQEALRHLSERGLIERERVALTEPARIRILAPWRERGSEGRHFP